MFSLRRIIKNYDETGSLNEQVSPKALLTSTSSSQRLVFTGHAADEEVQQESFFGIGVPVECCKRNMHAGGSKSSQIK